MNTQNAPVAFQISHVAIRQDDQGRYCLNDLHKASGGLQKHQPRYWLDNQQAKELIAELEKDDSGIPLSKIQGRGKAQGTYVVKELVYAYAMWISPKFHLAVIRAYDAQQRQPQNPAIESGHGVTLTFPKLTDNRHRRWLVTQAQDEMVTCWTLADDQEVITEKKLTRRIAVEPYLLTALVDQVPLDLLPGLLQAVGRRLIGSAKGS